MLNSFFGFRLNTGGVIVGWIGAVLSLITIVLLSVGLSFLDELAQIVFERLNDPDITQQKVKNILLTLLCIYITIHSINLAASALLVTGTVKERHLLLVPWLLNTGLSLLIKGIYILFVLITAVSQNVQFGSLFGLSISGVISLVFEIYVWYAIYSLFKQIQANRDMQQRLLPATTSATYPSYTQILK